MSNNNKQLEVPDWSQQLTEQLISQPIQTHGHISPLPSSAIIIHSENNKQDEQFQNYIDRQFTSNDATVLKNRLSETPSKTTTLRNSSNTIPPNYLSDIKDLSSKKPPLPFEYTGGREAVEVETESDKESAHVWWLLTKNDQDGLYSICGLLFLFGFIFPPCWWIGSIWPKHVREKGGKMADRWQKLNRIMSIGFSSILLILIIVFVVLYTTGNM
jgi:hypothetical protein